MSTPPLITIALRNCVFRPYQPQIRALAPGFPFCPPAWPFWPRFGPRALIAHTILGASPRNSPRNNPFNVKLSPPPKTLRPMNKESEDTFQGITVRSMGKMEDASHNDVSKHPQIPVNTSLRCELCYTVCNKSATHRIRQLRDLLVMPVR